MKNGFVSDGIVETTMIMRCHSYSLFLVMHILAKAFEASDDGSDGRGDSSMHKYTIILLLVSVLYVLSLVCSSEFLKSTLVIVDLIVESIWLTSSKSVYVLKHSKLE